MTGRHRRSRIGVKIAGLIGVLALILTLGTISWHVVGLELAKRNFNIEKVNGELQWFSTHGGVLNRIEQVSDTKLWLDLNLNRQSKDLESRLTAYQDNKHQFWLLLLKLQEGNLSGAQNLLHSQGDSSLRKLGQGLLYYCKGDPKGALGQLQDSGTDWTRLSRSNQALRHITLAKINLTIGDYQLANSELEEAEKLQPSHPTCLTVAFDIALAERQMGKAEELSKVIEGQNWRPKSALFETKRALLAIYNNNPQELSVSLDFLRKMPQGDIYINYVKGIEALSQGHLQDGKDTLNLAIKSGIDGEVKQDAQNALEQVTERQAADQNLRLLE